MAQALISARNLARESGARATLVLSPSDGRFWIATRDSVATGIVPLAGGVTLIGSTSERIEWRFEPSGPATSLGITAHGVGNVAVHVDRWSGEIGVGDARSP